jgi:hypothetical protein
MNDSKMPRRTALKLTGLSATSAIVTSVLGSCGARAEQRQTSQPIAQSPSSLITKEIPQTKERIPAIGLGTFMTFDVKPDQSRENLREVLQRFQAGGGRMIDVSPLYGLSEANVGEFI